MSNDVVPVDIPEDAKTEPISTTCDCPEGFQQFLRKLVPRGMLDERDERKEYKAYKRREHAAYKRLLVSLEGVPKARSWGVIKITIHAALLAVFTVALLTVVSIHKVRAEKILHLNIPWWVALFMIAVSGLPCIQFVTKVVSEPLIWYRIRRTRMYTVYAARKMKRSVDVTLWLSLVLLVWYTWFRPQIVKDTRGAKTLGIPGSQYEEALKMAAKQVTRLLMALTLGAFLWTLKDALYVRLNGNIHYKDLCELIRQTILDYHAIQFIDPDQSADSISLIDKGADWNDKKKTFWIDVSYLKKGTTPIWILKNLCALYREHMMNRKPKILLDLASTNDEEQFIKTAKSLYEKYTNYSREPKTRKLTSEDFQNCEIDPAEVEKLDHVLTMLYYRNDELGITEISEVEFQRWAVKALKGCLRLERILESSRHLFKKLNLLMICSVVVLVVIVWLLISEIVTTTQLAILFAPLVSASFVFGESLKKTFDGLIFVFGMHPFDVDQRVIVDGVQMRVTHLRLLTTVFFVYQTGDEVVYPNSVLATMSITKQDHTKYMPDFVQFTIPVDTPKKLISDLKFKIRKSLNDNTLFTPETEVAIKDITETNITVIVHFQYLVPYKSAESKARHRSEILEKIVRFCEEMKRVHEKEKAIENKKDEYEFDDTEEFPINAIMVPLSKIEQELKKDITEILQDCKSSKDFSQVLFTAMDKETITLAVRIVFRKDLLKHGDKEELKHKFKTLKEKYKSILKEEEKTDASIPTNSPFGSV